MRRAVRVAAVSLIAVSLFMLGGIGILRSIDGGSPAPGGLDPAEALSPLSPAAGARLSDTIEALQQRLRQMPDDWKSLAAIGQAYVQQARITQDPSYYPKAETALKRSLELQPEGNGVALVGMATLSSGRHDFADALEWGEQALATDPRDADSFGVVGDAQLELGEYDLAFNSYQRMVDTKPNLSSYTRVSYARELQGDLRGATAAMQTAQGVAGTPADFAWTSFQLGELAFNQGRIVQAAREYGRGLDADPALVANLAGLAKVAWARGDRDEAIGRYEEVVQRLPFPEYVIALGDAYSETGDEEAAKRWFDVVRIQQRLSRANGVNTDLELALFDADHGRPEAALQAARAEWKRRQSIHVADALSWALYANGRFEEAWRYSRKALALGTRNATFFFHAAMIRLALGDQGEGSSLLQQALDTNPHFSILYADDAAATLERLEDTR